MKTKRKTGQSGIPKRNWQKGLTGSYSKYRSGRILRKFVLFFLSLSFSCLSTRYPSLFLLYNLCSFNHPFICLSRPSSSRFFALFFKSSSSLRHLLFFLLFFRFLLILHPLLPLFRSFSLLPSILPFFPYLSILFHYLSLFSSSIFLPSSFLAPSFELANSTIFPSHHASNTVRSERTLLPSLRVEPQPTRNCLLSPAADTKHDFACGTPEGSCSKVVNCISNGSSASFLLLLVHAAERSYSPNNFESIESGNCENPNENPVFYSYYRDLQNG